MKQLKLYSYFLVISIAFASCSSSKQLTQEVKPAEINDVMKIEPFSYISLIENGNRGIHNDSISQNTQMVLNQHLETLKEKLSLSSDEIIISDLFDYQQLEDELFTLIQAAEKSKNLQNVSITPSLDFLLAANGKRFGLVVIQQGFTRDKGNYRGQIAKNIGLGIATGLLTGMAMYQVPLKSSSIVYAMIVDNQEKNVVFFNKSILQDKDPTAKENITKQINKVFEKYLAARENTSPEN